MDLELPTVEGKVAVEVEGGDRTGTGEGKMMWWQGRMEQGAVGQEMGRFGPGRG